MNISKTALTYVFFFLNSSLLLFDTSLQSSEKVDEVTYDIHLASEVYNRLIEDLDSPNLYIPTLTTNTLDKHPVIMNSINHILLDMELDGSLEPIKLEYP